MKNTSKKIITIVSPCFNEELNILNLYSQLNKSIENIDNYEFEYLFIDNASTDNTIKILKDIASKDKRVKIIINVRNFGHIRSPYWGILQSQGDATIYLASDLQDPPSLIPEFIQNWEKGYKVVWGVKPESETSYTLHFLRTLYYSFLQKISDSIVIKNATGFGLYDKKVLDIVREINEPNPYFRGIISELGYEVKTIKFLQNKRLAGKSKNNFYTLFDMAMLGIVNHSIIPLRVASFLGIVFGFLSFLLSIIFLIMKLLFWDSFQLGIAPILIGIFFVGGLILIGIGILGEYIASVHTYIRNRPIVVEKERINF
jgi:glycosyltransferase involved in cell wall biosynthesis